MEKNLNTESNCCQLIQLSPEGQQLSAIADALSVVSGTESLRSRLIHLAHKVDYLANDSRELAIVLQRINSLERELKEVRSLEEDEQKQLDVIVDKMRRNGSRMNHSTNFRQLLHDFLNHMTIRGEDGGWRYVDANKLVHKETTQKKELK